MWRSHDRSELFIKRYRCFFHCSRWTVCIHVCAGSAVVRNVLPLSHVAYPRLLRTPCSQASTTSQAITNIYWVWFARVECPSAGVCQLVICRYVVAQEDGSYFPISVRFYLGPALQFNFLMVSIRNTVMNDQLLTIVPLYYNCCCVLVFTPVGFNGAHLTYRNQHITSRDAQRPLYCSSIKTMQFLL